LPIVLPFNINSRKPKKPAYNAETNKMMVAKPFVLGSKERLRPKFKKARMLNRILMKM